MPAYHQMGHDTANLLCDPGLTAFGGMILSPVNADQGKAATQIAAVRADSARPSFDVVLDPQLYYPNTERGCLREWDYFPADVDTADLSSDVWWGGLTDRIATTAAGLESVMNLRRRYRVAWAHGGADLAPGAGAPGVPDRRVG